MDFSVFSLRYLCVLRELGVYFFINEKTFAVVLVTLQKYQMPDARRI